MEWLFIILTILISYVIIQLAIDRSLSAKLLKENLKVLIEIRELLEKQNKNMWEVRSKIKYSLKYCIIDKWICDIFKYTILKKVQL